MIRLLSPLLALTSVLSLLAAFWLKDPPSTRQPPTPESRAAATLWAVPRHAAPATPPPPGYTPAPIIGGSLAEPLRHPGQATLRIITDESETRRAKSLCEGTLLDDPSRRWILTAAHCVENAYLRIEVFGAGWRGLAYRAWSHAGHSGGAGVGDYALLWLDAPAPESATTARLATDPEIIALTEGQQLLSRGRGTTETGLNGPRAPSDALRESGVALIRATPFFLTVRTADGLPCIGDSGSALIDPKAPGVVLGVLSGVTADQTGVFCREEAEYVTAASGLAHWVAGVQSLPDKLSPAATR